MAETKEPLKCSFCGKGQSEAEKLIAGPGAFICECCLGLCCELMESEGIPNPWRRADDTDPEAFLWAWIGCIDTDDAQAVSEVFSPGVADRGRVRRGIAAGQADEPAENRVPPGGSPRRGAVIKVANDSPQP